MIRAFGRFLRPPAARPAPAAGPGAGSDSHGPSPSAGGSRSRSCGGRAGLGNGTARCSPVPTCTGSRPGGCRDAGAQHCLRLCRTAWIRHPGRGRHCPVHRGRQLLVLLQVSPQIHRVLLAQRPHRVPGRGAGTALHRATTAPGPSRRPRIHQQPFRHRPTSPDRITGGHGSTRGDRCPRPAAAPGTRPAAPASPTASRRAPAGGRCSLGVQARAGELTGPTPSVLCGITRGGVRGWYFRGRARMPGVFVVP